jgi:peptidylprolyl isomerase
MMKKNIIVYLYLVLQCSLFNCYAESPSVGSLADNANGQTSLGSLQDQVDTNNIITTETKTTEANNMTEKNENSALPKILIKISKRNSKSIPENYVQACEVTLELYPNKAPKHVERILKLVKEGFYNGLKFHRVIDGFMVQTGDPSGNGTGGSKLANLPAEFNDMDHVRGVLSMARASDPNSANSQFFIMLGDAPHLNGQYTAFGKVISGMDCVDKIKKGDGPNGMVSEPDIMSEVTVLSDPSKEE